MEEAIKKKGRVTSLSSHFPPEETQKALGRVQNAILDRRKNLDQLKEFIAENTNLINVVQTLPNELNHDIMVTLTALINSYFVICFICLFVDVLILNFCFNF